LAIGHVLRFYVYFGSVVMVKRSCDLFQGIVRDWEFCWSMGFTCVIHLRCGKVELWSLGCGYIVYYFLIYLLLKRGEIFWYMRLLGRGVLNIWISHYQTDFVL
jgi:hypothetical protein